MKDCYIFDLEGTLTDPTHRLHHAEAKDWDQWHAKFNLDQPRPGMVRLAQVLRNSALIIIMTGKEQKGKHEVIPWLRKQQLIIDSIIMRPDGDWSKHNAELKSGFVDELLAKGLNILAAFDDMPETVEMYRKRGILCLHC